MRLYDYVCQDPNHKEETMKRFITITLVLMIVATFIGCSGMTAEQRKEKYDLRESVGNSAFVGETSQEARSLARVQMYGP
jgi:hypothetical protein